VLCCYASIINEGKRKNTEILSCTRSTSDLLLSPEKEKTDMRYNFEMRNQKEKQKTQKG